MYSHTSSDTASTFAGKSKASYLRLMTTSTEIHQTFCTARTSIACIDVLDGPVRVVIPKVGMGKFESGVGLTAEM